MFAVERSSDDEPADLAGSGADLVELAVPHDPARRVVVDVAVAAKNLIMIMNMLFLSFSWLPMLTLEKCTWWSIWLDSLVGLTLICDQGWGVFQIQYLKIQPLVYLYHRYIS